MCVAALVTPTPALTAATAASIRRSFLFLVVFCMKTSEGKACSSAGGRDVPERDNSAGARLRTRGTLDDLRPVVSRLSGPARLAARS
jgi:hypothetical protein